MTLPQYGSAIAFTGLCEEMQVDECDDGSGFATITAKFKADESMETKEPTPEELAALAAKERADIILRCSMAGTTKGITEDERAKVANEPEFLKLCQAERRAAQESATARNTKRLKELGGKLKPGETLEDYDALVAKERL